MNELANNESGLTRSEKKMFDLFEIIIRNVNGLTMFLLLIPMREEVFNQARRSNQSAVTNNSKGRGLSSRYKIGTNTID